MNRRRPVIGILWATLLAGWAFAPDAARADPSNGLKKIVLIAGTKSHGPGDHEYEKGVKLLKECLDSSPNVKGVRTEVHLDGWPQDPRTLEDADTILFYCDGSDRDEKAHPLLREDRLATIERLMKRGVGFLAVHYAVFVPSQRGGAQYLDWLGGYFDYENGPAANKWYSKIVTKEYQVTPSIPDHPIARGLQPFSLREEYYFNMRFREKDRRLTPIVSFGDDKADLASVVGWAVERADGGRGFGYTGGHFHRNWDNEQVRKMMLNALLWTAKVEVPPGGVESRLPAAGRAGFDPASSVLKTLIITGHQYPGHKWRETTPALREVLAPDPRFKVEVTEDPETMATASLEGYQLLVLNYCNWERPGLSEAAKQKFQSYLSGGGGLSIIHFANGAFHFSLPGAPSSNDWPEYRRICRRVWDHTPGKSAHDPYGPFRVDVTSLKHPITDGLAAFETTDELYFNQQGDLPVEPLVTARSKITGRDEPLAFAYNYGQGRVFQTLLGHDAAAIRQAGELIRRGSTWAAGASLSGAVNRSSSRPAQRSGDKFGPGLDARKGHREANFHAAYQSPPLTIECWARLENASAYNLILANGSKDSAAHWEIFSTPGRGTFSAYLPGAAPDLIETTRSITDGQWHYLAMVYERDRVRLYVDASEVADVAIHSVTEGGPRDPLYFGAYPPQNLGCNGWLDDVRISRGVRRIQKVPEAAFTADESTAGLWNFDAEAERGFADASPLQNPAVARAQGQPAEPVKKKSEPKFEVELSYSRQPTRKATMRASLEATRQSLGTVQLGGWHRLTGADPAFGSDGGTDLAALVQGHDGSTSRWTNASVLVDGQWQGVEAGWLYRTMEAERDHEATFFIGSKRPVTVRFNGQALPSALGPAGWLSDQIANLNEKVAFQARLKRGVNHLSIRFSEPTTFYFEFDPLSGSLRRQLEERLDSDFSGGGEARYYRLENVVVPPHIVLEVGGMAFAQGHTLMMATRRGEIWAMKKQEGHGTSPSYEPRPLTPSLSPSGGEGARRVGDGEDWSLFASGLQEPLGLWPGRAGEVFVMQRSELTRIADTDHDGRADLFETLNSDCGVSASQHAYIYGPVRDQAGNFWGAISGIGVAGDGQYFGWSFKVTPRGEFIPWSSGLRSPNGIVLTPEGDLFIADNQGEYVGTSPLHHVSRGAFHGHPAGLKWDKTFSGDPEKAPIDELAKRRKPPAVLFPYGTMGQSLSQPLVDETGGKFGPFAGQMFIGDQTRCNVMRVFLQKVDGDFQGACFPFRSGFQSGNNRMAFAPDGSLYVGQTDRGWGSVGGRRYGLQRLVWTGQVPLEVQTLKLTATGFELNFTQPLAPVAALNPANYSLQHYHYLYQARYGSPQMDPTPTRVREARLSKGRKTVSLTVPELVAGRIYEFNLGKVRGADDSELLHPAAYYTLNRLVKD